VSAPGADALKRQAAEAAIDGEVRSGMALGLGTGSTANHMLEGLAARLADGRLSGIVGVPTSEATAERARELGVPLATLDERPVLDVAIDGADEIAPGLALVKGMGGAHLREKVVACAAARFVVVADQSKVVDRLGSQAPLPVEVDRFARAYCEHALAGVGWTSTLRLRQGAPWLTDGGNLILDCRREDWSDPATLDREVGMIPGVVEHGLFLGIAKIAYVGFPRGVENYEP
jgi:ribose 5-phosphate isomerase A